MTHSILLALVIGFNESVDEYGNNGRERENKMIVWERFEYQIQIYPLIY